MKVIRFIAVLVIMGSVSVAWFVLGGVVFARTHQQDRSLSKEMDSLWGPSVLAQPSPYWVRHPDDGRDSAGSVPPASSTITADIRHDHRYKGLLWYSTFTVEFAGEYVMPRSDGDAAVAGGFIFPLPAGVNGYDDLRVEVDGAPQAIDPADIQAGRLRIPVERQPSGPGHKVTVRYKTNGQDVWIYCPADVPAGSTGEDKQVFSAAGPLVELKDFSLTVTTDFADIDYPRGTRSPSAPAKEASGGRQATWAYASALTNQAMGVAMPKRPSAGPIVMRMSFFAPVSLFFFFTVLFTVVVIKKIPLHPMHYLFISAGFFAFHILLAYLADIMDVHKAFWLCAAVSVFLVVSYMRLVAGVKFAATYVALAQLVYLVGFSYAFFWKGRTGLTVVIGAIATLFVLMQASGRRKWQDVFGKPRPQPAVAATPAPVPVAGPAGASAPPPPPPQQTSNEAPA